MVDRMERERGSFVLVVPSNPINYPIILFSFFQRVNNIEIG